MILLILLVTNLISFMVWQNIKGLELDEKLSQLENSQLKLHQQYQELLIKYELLRSQKNVEQLAKKRLQMIPTVKNDFIQLGIKNKYQLLDQFLSNQNMD